MRTEEQMARIVQRVSTEAQTSIARKWGIPAHVLADATLSLGVKMLLESGCSEEQIHERVLAILVYLTSPPISQGEP